MVVVVAVSAGCGHGRRFVAPLRASTGSMRFLTTPVAHSTAPGLGPAHLVFLSPQLGFVATTGGGFYQEQVGYERPTEPALIERTVDGGETWRIVWRGPHVVFDRIVFADLRVGVAVGNVVAPRRTTMTLPPLHPLVLATEDGGMHWRRLRVPTSVAASTLELPTARAWFSAGRRLLVSTDEGRTWSPRSLPHAATLTTFPSASVGYTTAPAACGDELWKTADGGRTWSALPGTCATSYSSLDFVDARTGWVATGIRGYDYGSGIRPLPVVVSRTDDGGATWTAVHRSTTWLDDTRLHFTDRRHGWAVSRASATGAHAQFSIVHRTVDGGRSWRVVRGPALPTAFAGPAAAWAGDESGGLLWQTADGGRTWRLHVRPAYVRPSALLAATRSTLLIDSPAGTLGSDDGGRTWTSTPSPSGAATARALHEPAFLQIVAGRTVPRLSRDGGRTWRPLRRPAITRYEAGDVAFSDGEHGLLAAGQGEFGPDGRVPVFATHDGGATWRRLRMPPGVEASDEVTLAPGVVLVRRPPLLYLSTDEGRHWATVRVADDFWDCSGSRPQSKAIWILCSRSVTHGGSLLLRSDDGGTSWRELAGPVWLDAHVVALDGLEAWAIAKPAALDPGAGRALWHTIDGGSSWREVWPDLPHGTLVRDRRSFGPHLLHVRLR